MPEVSAGQNSSTRVEFSAVSSAGTLRVRTAAATCLFNNLFRRFIYSKMPYSEIPIDTFPCRLQSEFPVISVTTLPCLHVYMPSGHQQEDPPWELKRNPLPRYPTSISPRNREYSSYFISSHSWNSLPC